MKHEVFDDMRVPCMYAFVPLKSVLLGNHSLLLQNLAQWYLVGVFFKKILIGTEFRGTFCFARKWAQWAKNSGVFWKKNYLVFSLNNLKLNIVIYISLQSPCLSKAWFLSYVSKCFWPIRLQDSSKCNISRKKWETK